MDFLFVPSRKGFQKIWLSSLLYIRACRDHAELMTTDGLITTSAGLALLEKRLRDRRFCQVHSAYLVAMDKVIAFDHHTVELQGGQGIILPLEKKFRGVFRENVRIIEPFRDPLHHKMLTVDGSGRLTYI